MFPKRFGIFIKIMAISALSFCLPVMAQEQNGWQFDSLGSESDSTRPDVQRVCEVVLKMLDRWNAHDIGGRIPTAVDAKPRRRYLTIASRSMA